MDHDWGYVAAGYLGTAIVLGSYCALLVSRLRKASALKSKNQ